MRTRVAHADRRPAPAPTSTFRRRTSQGRLLIGTPRLRVCGFVTCTTLFPKKRSLPPDLRRLKKSSFPTTLFVRSKKSLLSWKEATTNTGLPSPRLGSPRRSGRLRSSGA